MGRELSADERESVHRASVIVRMAGFTEKADRIDNMLQEGDIEVDPDLKMDHPGHTDKVTLPPLNLIIDPSIELSPALFSGPQPMSFTSTELFNLARVLHHEADHAKCDDELAAWGGTYEFLCAVNDNLLRIYRPPLTGDEGLSGAELEAIENWKKEKKKQAMEERAKIARRGGTRYGGTAKPERTWIPAGPFKLGDLIVIARHLALPRPSQESRRDRA